MKIKINKLLEGKDITYSLPEVNAYPLNRWGDIARSQGLTTARNWRRVKEGTTKGINDFYNHPLTLGALTLLPLPTEIDMATDALKGTGIPKAVDFYTSLFLDPKKRAAHAFVNISPVNYRGKRDLIKGWIKDMLSGKDPNPDKPKWDIKELGKLTENYIPEWVKNREKIASQTREDAWRLYNHLPLKYNMYLKNADGTYSYNLKKINEISEHTFKPVPEAKYNGAFGHDYVTSAGGNLSANSTQFFRNKLEPLKRFGILIIEDIWDLHPFSRLSDLISKRFPWINKLPKHSLINKKFQNLEVGTISGGKPFKMHTEIPLTEHIDLLGNIDHVSGVRDYKYGFDSNYFIPRPLPNKYPKYNFNNMINSIDYNNIMGKYNPSDYIKNNKQ